MMESDTTKTWRGVSSLVCGLIPVAQCVFLRSMPTVMAQPMLVPFWATMLIIWVAATILAIVFGVMNRKAVRSGKAKKNRMGTVGLVLGVLSAAALALFGLVMLIIITGGGI